MERIGAQLLSFIVTIVTARILLPEEYGIVAIVSSFIAIADIFILHGLATSLIQKMDWDNIDFSTVIYINVFFG